MMIFIPIAGVAVLGSAVLYLQWRSGHGAGLFVLSTLPFACLFLAGAVPVAASRMLLEFQTIARTGESGPAGVEALMAAAARPLLLGSIMLLLTTCAAAVLQISAVRPVADPEAPPAPDVATPTSDLGTWILMLSSTALIPTVFLAHVMLDTARMVKAASRELPPTAAEQAAAPEAISQISSAIANRITSGIGLGALLVVFVAGVAVATIVAARFARETRLARNLSWVAFALVVVSALSLLYTMVAV
jgi:hypothetical protein